MENKVPEMKFPIFLMFVIGFLALTLVIQSVYLLETGENQDIGLDIGEGSGDDLEDINQENEVEVRVGDYYFAQENSDLPENELEAEVGDSIRFYNEGDMPHTVTIPELDIDEQLNPGEEISIEANKPVENVMVDCGLHANHDAELTVRE